MLYSDNPVADFARWDAEQNRQLARRPVCDWCGEHIQSDHLYRIDGKTICPDCLKDCREYIDDYSE